MKIIFVLLMLSGGPLGNNFAVTKIADFSTLIACEQASKSVDLQRDSSWDRYECIKIETDSATATQQTN